MARRRRQAQQLERVLGTNALFATAYGNVGSSIYYALGVVAVYALGLTPIVFIIAGLIFACTAATYAEGTVRYPEAGGSSSFARHAFNETVSFEAAWAQMLNYIATIAVSAFFVPHYLSVFWAPLRQNPWDIVGGIVVIVALVIVNIVGVQESAKLNVVLAVTDFATQLLLVLLGFILVFSPHILVSNVHLGVAPTWNQFFIAIPIAMLAYTGIETVSNLSEEARDPVRTVPRAVLYVAIAVFAIYFTLPWIALSAMPVFHTAHGYKTCLGQPPTVPCQGGHGYQNDPVLGLVNNLGLGGGITHVLQIYLGILASTILFIGANAGVIGASRITYAMSSYRQLPLLFRKIHPRFKTPWLALVFFAGAIPVLLTLTGQTKFLGAIYSFGATFSFTVAHASIIRLRTKRQDKDEVAFKARPNFRWRGVSWPVFAIVGGLGTGLSWLVIVIQTPVDPLRGHRLARHRIRLLRLLPPPDRARSARRDDPRAGGVRAGRGARVPQHPRADRARLRLRRGDGCRVPARGGAACIDRRVHGDRGTARPAARRRAAGGRGGGERAARRGACDRRLVRRDRDRPHRAHPEDRPCHRRRGDPARLGDHRHGGTAPRAAPARPASDLRRRRRLRPTPCALPGHGRHAAGARRMRFYKRSVHAFGFIAIGLGLAILIETAAEGGGSTGFLLGVLFVGLGCGRLYLARRR